MWTVSHHDPRPVSRDFHRHDVSVRHPVGKEVSRERVSNAGKSNGNILCDDLRTEALIAHVDNLVLYSMLAQRPVNLKLVTTDLGYADLVSTMPFQRALYLTCHT